jgi:hypothetical protein
MSFPHNRSITLDKLTMKVTMVQSRNVGEGDEIGLAMGTRLAQLLSRVTRITCRECIFTLKHFQKEVFVSFGLQKCTLRMVSHVEREVGQRLRELFPLKPGDCTTSSTL